MNIFSVKGLLITGVLLALVAGGLLTAWVLRLAEPASQVPAAPMIVSLTQPANGSGAGAGSTVHVSSQVVASHAVISAELWVDNFLAGQTAPIRVATNVYTASLEWTPTPGAHVLVIRATDDQGHIGLSNIVRVDGRVATNSMAMEPFVARGGETLEALAQTFGTTVPAIQTYNRGLSEGQALEPGQELSNSDPFPLRGDVGRASARRASASEHRSCRGGDFSAWLLARHRLLAGAHCAVCALGPFGGGRRL